uniref:Fibulin-2-like isoform X2 n=1 Tax=Petromyzon marinus TaxID=7757 RepID=A0AAJ7TXP1_PETMA|nr:fibulin-2-like isoform X2 [Petromyzon marinus]
MDRAVAAPSAAAAQPAAALRLVLVALAALTLGAKESRAYPPDCAGVVCPPNDHCIAESSEPPTCCPACLQLGCTCHGYQYYDCVAAGYTNGKVPEGHVYYVDDGTTACSCPARGGSISCSFMPCPDLPSNCIEVHRPLDHCPVCLRAGCVSDDGHNHDAGFTFRLPGCRVCHCPLGESLLLCYTVPGCDSAGDFAAAAPPVGDGEGARGDDRGEDSYGGRYENAASAAAVAGRGGDYNGGGDGGGDGFAYGIGSEPSLVDNKGGRRGDDYGKDGDGSHYDNAGGDGGDGFAYGFDLGLAEHPDYPWHANALPSYPLYGDVGANYPSPDVHDPSLPKHQPHPLNLSGIRVQPNLHVPLGVENGLHDPSVNELPPVRFHFSETASAKVPEYVDTAPNLERSAQLADNYVTRSEGENDDDRSDEEEGNNLDGPRAWHGGIVLTREVENTLKSPVVPAAATTPTDGGKSGGISEHGEIVNAKAHGTAAAPHREKHGQLSPEGNGRFGTWGTIGHAFDSDAAGWITVKDASSVTGTAAAKQVSEVQATIGWHRGQNRGVTTEWARDFSAHGSTTTAATTAAVAPAPPDADSTGPPAPATISALASLEELIGSCCDEGRSWAMATGHCVDVASKPRGVTEECRITQEQCCLAAVQESQCGAGISVAKRGGFCTAEPLDPCGAVHYKQCCECCSLGLRARRRGRDCEASLGSLGSLCALVLHSCCREPETAAVAAMVTTAQAETLRTQLSVGPALSTAAPRATLEPMDGSAETLEGSTEALEPGATVPSHSIAAAAAAAAADAEASGGEEDAAATELCQGGACAQLCHATEQGIVCSCSPGFRERGPGDTCADIDECESGAHNCSEGQECRNTWGSFVCSEADDSCRRGFVRNPRGRCVDVNECLAVSRACGPAQRCVNSPGSFSCERGGGCDSGYQLDEDNDCIDIDECVTGGHDCTNDTECSNTKGSFLCQARAQCGAGYRLDDTGGCADVDECSAERPPCAAELPCVNTAGSFQCGAQPIPCARGFIASPSTGACTDVDECTTGVHGCGEGQLCRNLLGSYRCECRPGYRLDPPSRSCLDVDECSQGSGKPCEQLCENTQGSFRCLCARGLALSYDGRTCEDVDECLRPSVCQQRCSNTYGSYRCHCEQGYRRGPGNNSATCEDIDECSGGVSGGEICTYRCVNTPGSYECRCPVPGYTVSPNGHACRDIDECSSGTHNCTSADICYNVAGGFRCLAYSCPPNYKKTSVTRCERISCVDDSDHDRLLHELKQKELIEHHHHHHHHHHHPHHPHHQHHHQQDCATSPATITYHRVTFPASVRPPAAVLHVGPSSTLPGDSVLLSVSPHSDPGAHFGVRALAGHRGALFLRRPLGGVADFLLDVQVRLLRRDRPALSLLARVFVVVTDDPFRRPPVADGGGEEEWKTV